MKELKTKSQFIRWLIFIFCLFFIGLRYLYAKPNYPEGTLLQVTANVAQEPRKVGTKTVVQLAGLWVSISQSAKIEYGDRVTIRGKYQSGRVNNAEVISLGKSSFFLVTLRKQILQFYKSNLSDPYSSLIAGIALGSKEALSDEFKQALRNTGTSHVIVASGMNVTLVGGFIFFLFLGIISRPRALIVSIAIVWVYVFLAGFEAPVIRAAIMTSIAWLGMLLGRVTQITIIFVFCALIMLIVNPLWLEDVGFYLSFAATLGLLLFETKISGYLAFLPRFIKESLSTSLAAQIGVAPVLIIVFGEINLLGPFVNALVLWTIAPLTVLSGSAGIISLVSPLIGRILLILCYPLAWWFVSIVQLFA